MNVNRKESSETLGVGVVLTCVHGGSGAEEACENKGSVEVLFERVERRSKSVDKESRFEKIVCSYSLVFSTLATSLRVATISLRIV